MEGQILAFSAVHIAGLEKWQVDFLSCPHINLEEWSLYQDLFQHICVLWGTPNMKSYPDEDIHWSLSLPWHRTTSWARSGDPFICFCSRRLPFLFAITLPRRVWKLVKTCHRRCNFSSFIKIRLFWDLGSLSCRRSSFHINVDIVLYFFCLGLVPTKVLPFTHCVVVGVYLSAASLKYGFIKIKVNIYTYLGGCSINPPTASLCPCPPLISRAFFISSLLDVYVVHCTQLPPPLVCTLLWCWPFATGLMEGCFIFSYNLIIAMTMKLLIFFCFCFV